MTDDAYFAISVPYIPQDMPTSATLSAGASDVPSPVTATTFPVSLRPFTNMYLSYGVARANTFILLSKSVSLEIFYGFSYCIFVLLLYPRI